MSVLHPQIEAMLREPRWRPRDLGLPIPDSPHAVSVCLPRWADVVGYEEQDPRVIDAMRSGYPRFFMHESCRRLAAEVGGGLEGEPPRGGVGRRWFVMASPGAAERCAAFLAAKHPTLDRDALPRTAVAGGRGATVIGVPSEAIESAEAYWRHTGEGLPARTAERLSAERSAPASLRGPRPEATEALGGEAEGVATRLRERIAEAAGTPAADVFLFPTGMTAVYTVHRALRLLRGAGPSVQLGFPYVDTLKILEKFGPGAVFIAHAGAEGAERLRATLAEAADRGEPAAGVFTEMPSNPLLVCPDLVAISGVCRRDRTPLVVDDTLAGWVGADLRELADVTCTSLTKSFSGVGDVAGGCAIIQPGSPMRDELRQAVEAVYEDLNEPADLLVLERNSRDYASRTAASNASAAESAAWLASRSDVARVHHPSLRPDPTRDRFSRGGNAAGWGSLLSIELVGSDRRAAAVYDRLRLCKGPNLGMGYTLVCPYTLLAHYRELDFARRCGVPSGLLRVSVGLEPMDELRARFEEALAAGAE